MISVHNTALYLPQCIEFLLGQSFWNFENLLVNDGLSADTGTVVDMLQTRERRIRGIHIPHGGVSAARNMGLQMAKGNYVLFVDSGDALVSGILACIHWNIRSGLDMLCFGLLSRSFTERGIFGQCEHRENHLRYKSVSETADDCI